MEINSAQTFLDYFEKVRFRTERLIPLMPEEMFEWTYKTGKFSFGDLIRHLAGIERFMYAENAQFKPSKYPGHHYDLAPGRSETINYFERLHNESLEIFGSLAPEDLHRKTKTPTGTPITLWKWLRLMIEHEIHHRGQMYMYLSMLDIPSPPMYGLTSEEVLKGSK